jgi:hypothetical protein
MDKVYCEDCKFVRKNLMPSELWQCSRDEYKWSIHERTAVVRNPPKKTDGFCAHNNKAGTCPYFEQRTPLLIQIKDFFLG